MEAKEKGAANGCEPPSNSYWDKETLARWPVTHVTWQQASQYATWKGSRLPTEAEWEKACRSTDARIYPWGDELPTNKLANFNYNEGTVTYVGNYVDGQSPYGLLDMAGNVWEWTSSQFQEYPYEADDGREEPTGDAGAPRARTLRGVRSTAMSTLSAAPAATSTIPRSRSTLWGFGFCPPAFDL